jgi:ribosomal-protein-alanine N-acetyltransferase
LAVKVLETERLILRRLTKDDAPFIFELVNDPDWLRFIGDRGVRTLDHARDYIVKGPVAMYARLGFGLYLVELKHENVPMGMCGLLKREELEDVDLGFAFMPQYRGQGYAYEAAAAAMVYGRKVLGLKRVVAIVSADNEGSARLLEKLGFRFERMIRFPGDADEIRLFSVDVA